MFENPLRDPRQYLLKQSRGTRERDHEKKLLLLKSLEMWVGGVTGDRGRYPLMFCYVGALNSS